MNPRGSGSSACRSIPPDEQLVAPARAFVERARWRGLFMLELLRDVDGQAWFVELNGRPWGSLALSRRRGLEYPAWAVAQSFDPALEPTVPVTPHGPLCRHLGRELVHLLHVLRGQGSRPAPMWPSRLGTLRDVLSFRRTDQWYNRRPGRTRLFVDDTVRTVLDEVWKGRGA
jgi:hypothetical protein